MRSSMNSNGKTATHGPILNVKTNPKLNLNLNPNMKSNPSPKQQLVTRHTMSPFKHHSNSFNSLKMNASNVPHQPLPGPMMNNSNISNVNTMGNVRSLGNAFVGTKRTIPNVSLPSMPSMGTASLTPMDSLTHQPPTKKQKFNAMPLSQDSKQSK